MSVELISVLIAVLAAGADEFAAGATGSDPGGPERDFGPSR